MGRKRKTAISLETGEVEEYGMETQSQPPPPQPQPNPQEPQPKPQPRKIPPGKPSMAPRRISVELNDDGSVAWNSMRETNVIEFRSLLNRPEIKEEFKEKTAPPLFSAESCYGFYDLFGKLLAFGAAKWKGIPADIATEAFSFSDGDKKILAEPTVKVLNKYAPTWAIKYQDEITLGFVLLSVINAKIMLARALAESRAEGKVVEIPIPKNVQ